MRMRRNTILIILVVLLFIPLAIQARVTEIIVTKTESPTFGGTEFGKVGQYERLEGIIKCEVDPKQSLNAVIVNIDKAPKNAKGFVEYDVDFVILKPIDMNKGNHFYGSWKPFAGCRGGVNGPPAYRKERRRDIHRCHES